MSKIGFDYQLTQKHDDGKVTVTVTKVGTLSGVPVPVTESNLIMESVPCADGQTLVVINSSHIMLDLANAVEWLETCLDALRKD